MVLSLQEISYLKLSRDQRKHLPIVIQTLAKRQLVSRIIKTWKNSNMYKAYFGRKMLENRELVTKNVIILVIKRYCLQEKNIYYLVNVIHTFLHNDKPEEKINYDEMLSILSLFITNSKNNSHMFFSQLWTLVSSSEEFVLDDKTIHVILSVLSKNTLLDFYKKRKNINV